MSGHTPWAPSDEALGAALIGIRQARLPWYVRLVLRDGSKACSALARSTARRVEGTVGPRERELTTARINASWEKALAERAEQAEALEAGALPPFNSVTRCRKCGHVTDPAGRTKGYVRPRGDQPEAMQRFCTLCGFSWLESPADTEALSATQSADPDSAGSTDAEGLHDAPAPSALPVPGHSSPMAPAGAHGDAETPAAADAANETPNAAQPATEPPEGREGAS